MGPAFATRTSVFSSMLLVVVVVVVTVCLLMRLFGTVLLSAAFSTCFNFIMHSGAFTVSPLG